MEDLRSLYEEINFDGDSGLSESELIPFLQLVAHLFVKDLANVETLSTMFHIVDRDQSGEVNWSEFLWFMTFLKGAYVQAAGRMMKRRTSVEELKELKASGYQDPDDDHDDAFEDALAEEKSVTDCEPVTTSGGPSSAQTDQANGQNRGES